MLLLLLLTICFVSKAVFAQEPAEEKPALVTTTPPPRVIPLQTTLPPPGTANPHKYAGYVNLEGLDPKAFDGLLFKVTLKTDAKSNTAVNGRTISIFESQSRCGDLQGHLVSVRWNAGSLMYCVDKLANEESSNDINIFLEHRNLQMESLTDECLTSLAESLPEILDLKGVDVKVVDQKYDLTTLSWVPPTFPGQFMIALDACKKEAPIEVKIVRILAMAAGMPRKFEDFLQPAVIVLHTLFDGMNDLLQVEQGGTVEVSGVHVIPFYFYFKAASVEADQLIVLVKKILELASGLSDSIQALLVPTVYVQQCEDSVDAYPLEVANFKAELKTTPEMARLLNAEEKPNKDLEAKLRSDIKTLMKGKFSDERVYKSATVDYLVSEGQKLSVAFHVNFDGYRIDTNQLDEWEDAPIESTLLTSVTTQGRYPTHKRITCSNLKSVKLDILVPPADT
ncbi:hypothetical protein CRM22_008576 [Opisthorchis felineus]|uniref:Uncharacterized protein n=1 Tax=Opisthorchis felineus TaxID=147828 RepID=A0A4S2LIV6_OPIFE|nr:hypothetical protein CRM22_008576 [Opisthorchis felineus]